MRIGIDIDDTLTDIRTQLNEAVYQYAKQLGKTIKDSQEKIQYHKNDGNQYKEKFDFSYEELKYFLKNIQEEITSKAKPRENVKEIIDQLRKDGHEIYIITARDNEFHEDPYELSKNWLEKNQINYDKLIVNAREKATICEQEKIDLFIDDQLTNCRNIAKKGISVIRITEYTEQHDSIVNQPNWKKIYEYISKLETNL